MRALVTGACGFVGRYLCEHLVAYGDEVLGLVYVEEAEGSPFKTAKLDISDAGACSSVISAFKPEVIYHLAGISFVPEAEGNFDNTLRVNVGGTNNIYRTCHLLQTGIKVVFVSSAEVYGRVEPADLPIKENQPVRPANNYSLSKAMAELVAKRYEQYGQLKSAIMRPFNHIGPGQNNRFVASSFAYQLASIARGRAAPCLKVGNLAVRRDFSDVRDIVRAYRLAGIKGSGVYNLGSGVSVSIQRILDRLIEIAGIEVSVEVDQSKLRGAEVQEIYGSFDRARGELEWMPEHSLDSTLADIYRYWYDRV